MEHSSSGNHNHQLVDFQKPHITTYFLIYSCQKTGKHLSLYIYHLIKMAIIKELNGVAPVIGERAFLAETSTIIGTVTMGEDCSIWYGAVLRADVGAIRIGDRVNVQDNAVLHATYKQSECIIGNDVSIGHGANVHGAVIGNDVIIGMGAIVMDHTVVPDGTIIAAGAVVPANQVLESGIYAGVPARKIKDGSEAIRAKAHANAQNYLLYKTWYE